MTPVPERMCEQCGTLITADHLTDPELKSRAIRKNRFCNQTCSNRWTALNRSGPSAFKGRRLTTRGYVEVLAPESPMATKTGYVMEHRLLMAEHLGRPLTSQEIVHHRNHVKDDNRIENLELMEKQIHDRLPKPPPKPFECPNCKCLLQSFGNHSRVRTVVVVEPPPE